MSAGVRKKWRVAGMGLLVVLVALALYAPAIGYDLLNLDDAEYITENPLVAGGMSWSAVHAAVTRVASPYWAPLLWLSYMLDVELFGLEPWGFHLVNVLLFAGNAGLLFWLVRRWTGRTGVALAVALLWALHPARVESVAWIAERKDVLSGVFFLLGLGAYVEGRRGTWRHGVACAWLCLVLGGAAKPSLVVMPAVMILVDVWPLERTGWSRFGRDIWRLALEKWAFWAVALVLAMSPIWVHHREDLLMTVSIHQRLAMIPVHYFFYFQKLVWPSGLAVLLPDLPFQWGPFAAGTGILLGVTFGLWRLRETAPWALMGWLWFVGALFPLTGVVWGGAERVAVRFEYLPQMGLLLAAVLAADRLLRARGWNWRWGAAAGALTAAVWGGLTLRLLPNWRNSLTIHQRVLQLNPNSIHAFDNLGEAFFLRGQFAEWQAFLEQQRRAHPGNVIVNIHYAWWQAAMLGDSAASTAALVELTGRPATHPDFWTWLDGKTNDRKLLGLWRDTAGICLRSQGDLARMEELQTRWAPDGDARTRGNFLDEMEIARWLAGPAPAADGGMLARFVSRWQQGARGYAFVGFRNYAQRAPDDGAALNNLAWLVATAPPDGLRHVQQEEWPATALAWAERALMLSDGRLAGVWDTLAAARANAGDFEGALAAAGRGLELARESNERALAPALLARINAYRAGRPWREPQTDLTPGGKRVE